MQPRLKVLSSPAVEGVKYPPQRRCLTWAMTMLRHADRIVIDGLEVLPTMACIPRENALGQKFIVSLVLYADLRAAGNTITWMPRLTTARCATMSMAICASIRLSSSRRQPRGQPRCCCAVIPRCLVRIKLDKPWAPVGLPLANCGVEIEACALTGSNTSLWVVARSAATALYCWGSTCRAGRGNR